MSIKELETAVTKLSPEDLARFAEWVAEYRSNEWDRQIEEDARAGRLNALVREAEDDLASRQARTARHIEELRAFRESLTLGDEVSIRGLIDEGRV